LLLACVVRTHVNNIMHVSIDAIETNKLLSDLESLVLHGDLGGVPYNREVLVEKVKRSRELYVDGGFDLEIAVL
jgi:hypothetical protein